MPLRIEEYGLLGDTSTAALVGIDGSIDWLCLPRFDSAACFAALLGDPEHGRWRIAPQGVNKAARRSYRGDSLVLETEFDVDGDRVRVVDCMPVRRDHPMLVRLVEGVRGRVRMRSELVLRFDYGDLVPLLRHDGHRLRAFAGPNTVSIDSDIDQDAAHGTVTADFSIGEGEQVGFRLAWSGPRQAAPGPLRVTDAVEATRDWWQEWAGHCLQAEHYRDAVVRSMVTLKALTYGPSGGIVAAPTTSLPEQLGGPRNWDYRFCWIRDATFTLLALLDGGYQQAACAWREWVLRALAGEPRQMQIMYGVEGERRLTEQELDHLPGYEGSRPVRIGNAAAGQYQLDVYGELMDALHQARAHGIEPDPVAWDVQRALMDFLESNWRDPDNGLWEMRGPRRDFTHSKVMAWVAADRAVQAVHSYGLDGPVERWKRLREEIHQEVCDRGYDPDRGTFTQYYGSESLDAALLLIPSMGFLPATDERMRGTVAAIERDLCADGFVQRYPMDEQSQQIDGLPPGEGAFLACTFWLADNYVLQGRREQGRETFERLLELRNDLGLLAEEYDPKTGRLVGNFPQAFAHVPLINTARTLASAGGPVQRRARTGEQEQSGQAREGGVHQDADADG